MTEQQILSRALVHAGVRAGAWLWVAATVIVSLMALIYGAVAFNFKAMPTWLVVAGAFTVWIPFALMFLSPRSVLARGLYRVLLAGAAGIAFGYLASGTVKWFHGMDLVLAFLCWGISFLWWHDELAPDAAMAPAEARTEAQANSQGDSSEEDTSFLWKTPTRKLDSLSGMHEVKDEIAEVLKNFRGYAKGGEVSDRNGVLLFGTPGNGKSSLAEAMAAELDLPLLKVGVQDITSKWVNDSAPVIHKLFAEARTRPCVLFFDEFDAVAPSRSGGGGMHNEDKKVVNALLAEIDRARGERIVLVAATNFPDELDPAIAREGRFDFKIELPPPDVDAREGMLSAMLTQYKLRAEPDVVRRVAELWERRSAAFIESTVKRLRDSGKGKHACISANDFKTAARAASRRPGAMPSKGLKVSELYLPESVRTEVASLTHRLVNWEAIAERGGETPSGILLYGPPGTGKTALVQALARELGDWHVFEVSTPDILQDPRKFKKTVELAAQHRPAFVFLDEAEDLLRHRQVSSFAVATNEILKSMDGAMGKIPEVVFIAATNDPEAIDAAAVRGGRFAEKIYMGPFSGAELVEFLEGQLHVKMPLKVPPKVSAGEIADLLGEAVPANAIALIRKAINYTFTESGQRSLDMADIKRAKEALGL